MLGVGVAERGECPLIHGPTIGQKRPPGKVRAAYFSIVCVLPATAREEPEQYQDQNDDQDDVEKTHGRNPLSVRM